MGRGLRVGISALAGVLLLTGCEWPEAAGRTTASSSTASSSTATASSSPVPTGSSSSAGPSDGSALPSAALPSAALPEPPAPEPVPDEDGSLTVLDLLDRIEVKGRAPKTGYDRDLFGQRWSDDVTVAGGHNGCDTRNDILARDLEDLEYKPGTRDCVVLRGVLDDPYTGRTIEFQRGQDTSTAVQIDHVVPLADAWQKGAQSWDEDTRRNFANDPRNLQAVDGPTNQSKGAGDTATWLPPDRAYWCEYVARQVIVKAAYNLWMTEAEHARSREILTDRCATPPPVRTVDGALVLENP